MVLMQHPPNRLLLVFDGGDAPGYSSVAVALTEEGTRRGYEVWAATEGFRSLTADARADPAFERLIMSRIRKREPDPIVKRACAAGEVKLDSAKDRRSAIQRNAEVEQALAAAAAH